MKKGFAFICLLCILFTVVPAALAAPEDTILFDTDQLMEFGAEAYTDPGMALVGDTLYSTWGSKMFSWKQGQEKPEVVAAGLEPNMYQNYQEAQQMGDNPDMMIAYLVSDGTALYGLNRLNGMLYPFTLEAGKAVSGTPVQLDWSDMEYTYNNKSYVREFRSIYLIGGKLYGVNWTVGDTHNPEFVSYDITTGAKQVYDIPFVQDITPYKDGKLLLKISDIDRAMKEDRMDSITHALAIFDPSVGSCTEVGYIPDAYVFGMVYQPETDVFYYCMTDKIMGMRSFGAAAQVAEIPYQFAGNGSPAVMLSGGVYAIGSFCGIILRDVGNESSTGGSLSSSGFSMSSSAGSLSVYGQQDTMGEEFAKKNPDVSVKFGEDMYFEDYLALSQAMMTGDATYDVYSIDLSEIDIQSLIKKGYCMDLSSSPLITSEISKMYPFLQNTLMRDGKIYAVPVSMRSSGFGIEPESWEETGLTSRLPKNFPELIDFMNWWADEGYVQYPDIQLIDSDHGWDIGKIMTRLALDLYMQQSQARNDVLSFDTPLFRKTMEALERLKVEELNDLVFSNADDAMSAPCLFVSGIDGLSVGGGNPRLRHKEPLSLPLAEGEAVSIPVYVRVLFINPNTKNLDIALEYLESALERMERAQHIMMVPDDNEPVPNENLENVVQFWNEELAGWKKRLETAEPEDKKELEDVIRGLERDIAQKDLYYWKVSAESISSYRQKVPLCYVTAPYPVNFLTQNGTAQIKTLVDRYRQKQISLDQFINEADQKIQMILSESK